MLVFIAECHRNPGSQVLSRFRRWFYLLGESMDIKHGELVKTETGDVGKVVHISRLTVFVAFEVLGNERIEPFLASQLTKVDRAKCAV